MKTLDNKLIIYDSNCKVCSSLRDLVLTLTSIPESKVMAYKDLSSDLSTKVDADKFKNVMALIDTSGGQTVYGAEGVAYIFSSQYKVVDFLLSWQPVFYLFGFLYKTQAYNRYIIATPKSKFYCDCFPDNVIRYRVSYILITLLISLLFVALFGMSLTNIVQFSVFQIVLVVCSAWVIQSVLALMILKKKALDYIGHLGSIIVAGLLILIPSIIYNFIATDASLYVPAISVALSFIYILYLHIGRVKYLGISQVVTFVWLLIFLSPVLYLIYYLFQEILFR